MPAAYLRPSKIDAAKHSRAVLKLLKIGARIIRSVRRVVLYLASSYPFQALLGRVLRRLRGAHWHPT